jgi:Pilus formation protein N terminal region
MLKMILPIAILIATFGAQPAPAMESKDADIIHVTIDQAKVIKAPPGTATLVIGNPLIADVSMLKGGVGMVVTGKGYGQTNLLAIDAEGTVLGEKQLRVEPGNTVLVVQRGDSRASYSCNPYCMPTVQLGDDDKVFGAVGGQITQRNGLASGNGGAK